MSPRSGRPMWSKEDISRLISAYTPATINTDIHLDDLALELGRNKTNVCRKARALGLTNIARKRVIEIKKKLPKYGPVGSEELRIAKSEGAKQRLAENGHPRGALGMKHTQDAKKKMVAATRRAWADPNSKFNSEENRQRKSDMMIRRVVSGQMRGGGYSRCASGKRADLGGTYFRSRWEANYARFLEWLKKQKQIAKWEYEVHTFEFVKIKRGTRAYTPDFKVTYASGKYEWHEVKGWMDPKSVTRLRRMEKYFPEEKVIVIGSEWFRDAKRQGIPSLLQGWE